MKFIKTKIPNCYLIEIDVIRDNRGEFMRSYCKNEFKEIGEDFSVAQTSISVNYKKGTTRGLHFQNVPHMEAKLVQCLKGRVFDVMVDIRLDSPTYGQWVCNELTEDNNIMFYSPAGFAHGFQALEDNSIIQYQMSEFYTPSASAGIRWDDSSIGIDWPLVPTEQSERDINLPLLKDLKAENQIVYKA